MVGTLKRVELPHRAKFRQNRSNRGRDISQMMEIETLSVHSLNGVTIRHTDELTSIKLLHLVQVTRAKLNTIKR